MKKNLLVGIIVTIMMVMAVIIAYQSGALVSADRCIKEYEVENRKLQNEIYAKEEEINEVTTRLETIESDYTDLCDNVYKMKNGEKAYNVVIERDNETITYSKEGNKLFEGECVTRMYSSQVTFK